MGLAEEEKKLTERCSRHAAGRLGTVKNAGSKYFNLGRRKRQMAFFSVETKSTLSGKREGLGTICI